VNRTRRIAVVAVAALLAVPGLTACNLPGGATCDAISLTVAAGGKGGGGGGKSGKSSTTKTKPKTGTAPKVGHADTDDDCDDD
jgi:hypothetical protein